jgi:hypothetical protein
VLFGLYGWFRKNRRRRSSIPNMTIPRRVQSRKNNKEES